MSAVVRGPWAKTHIDRALAWLFQVVEIDPNGLKSDLAYADPFWFSTDDEVLSALVAVAHGTPISGLSEHVRSAICAHVLPSRPPDPVAVGRALIAEMRGRAAGVFHISTPTAQRMIAAMIERDMRGDPEDIFDDEEERCDS